MLFEWWYWRRLLRVPWTARRFNGSILKAISPEYSLEGLMLTPKLQYFGHLKSRWGEQVGSALGGRRVGEGWKEQALKNGKPGVMGSGHCLRRELGFSQIGRAHV